MRCLIIAENSKVIKTNLEHVFSETSFETCPSVESAEGRYDVVLISRFLCDRRKLTDIAVKFALARIVFMVGELDEDSNAFIKAIKNMGLTNYVTGALPGDRPYTLLIAMQEDREVILDEEQTTWGQDALPVNLLDRPQEAIKQKADEPEITSKPNKQPDTQIIIQKQEALAQEIALIVAKQNTLTQEIAALTQERRAIQAPERTITPQIQVAERGLPRLQVQTPEQISYSQSVLVAVSANKGGVGKTTTISTLAIALAHAGVPVTIIDLDFHGANISVFFGLTPSKGIETLSKRDDISLNRLIPEILLETSYKNLAVMPGIVNKSLAPGELFTSEELVNIIHKLKEISPVVLVDTPPGFWAYDYLFDTFASADMILSVVDQSSFSKDDIRQYAPYLFSMGVSPEKIKIILNRFSPKLSKAREIEKIFAESVSSKVKPQIIATIPNDWDIHVVKSSRAEAVGLDDPKNQWHHVAAEVASIAGFEYQQKVQKRKNLREFLGLPSWK